MEVLCRDVQAAMADVLPSSDPLDSNEFDAVAYMNIKFPSERALGTELDSFIEEIASQIGVLDDEISQAVYAQAEAGARAKRDIEDARAAMGELSTKIVEIRGKADESEAIVREICRDIKSLDVAKRNLEKTITALKRMHMLAAAVAQLRTSSRAKRYGETANLLEAIGHLLAYFEPHGDVPRVSELKAEVAATRKRLEGEVFEAFHSLGVLCEAATEFPSGGAFASLSEACQVIDAVGDEARERQVYAFCSDQLVPYRELFPRGGEHSTLDEVDRRFSWIRRLLRTFQDRFHDNFPSHWQLDRCLVRLFVDETRTMFLEILSSGEQHNVTTILKALQKTLVFEKEVQARFDDMEHRRAALKTNKLSLSSVHSYEPDEEAKQHNKHGDGAVQRREWRKGEINNASNSNVNGGTKNSSVTVNNATKPIAGSLSSVFDPYMQPYVALEKKNMEEMMQKVAAEEDVDRDGALPVFASSVHVFAYIKTSVRRCTALSTGQTFFKLFKSFCDCLREYAHRLTVAMDPTSETAIGSKKTASGGGTVSSSETGVSIGSQRSNSFLAKHDAVSIACYALNTAEYCADTVEQLGEIVKGKVDAAYVNQIDTEKEVEAFHDVVAAAIKRIVSIIDCALEPAFKRMNSTNWGTLDTVDEESQYVRDIILALRDKVPAARALLSPSYFRNLCDKVAASSLPKFYNNIVTAKRISEMATHQLLLDLHSLKPIFLELPNVKPPLDVSGDCSGGGGSGDEAPVGGSGGGSAVACESGGGGLSSAEQSIGTRRTALIKPPASFVKFVTKHTTKIEMILKLVGTPTEMLVERFKIMWPDGSRQDLLHVCALKGLKKQEQLALADTFAGTTANGVPIGPVGYSALGSGPGPFGVSLSTGGYPGPSLVASPGSGLSGTDAIFNLDGGDDNAGSSTFIDRSVLESKLESVSATASLTINKAASQMRDLMNMQRATKP